MSFRNWSLILVLTLCTAVPTLAADATPEASATLLAKADSHPAIPLEPQAKRVLDRAARDPAFRAEVIKILAGRLSSYAEPYKGDQEIVALRRLKATEAIPALKQRWEKTPKHVYYMPHGDPRVQLATTLAVLLPLDARVEFLVNTIDDEAEAPQVRLFAEVAAAADGDKALVDHLTKRYRKQCEVFPRTLYSPVLTYKPTKEPWDQDGDGISDYDEQGLLLDPKNPDTDGDGIPDGDDRNPLTAPKGPLTENQKIAQLLFCCYDRCLTYQHSDPGQPVWRLPGRSDLVLFAVTTNKAWDGSNDPSLLAGVEIIGVNRVILPGGPAGKRYADLHGPTSMRSLEIVCINELKKADMRQMMLKQANMTDADGDRLFMVGEFTHNNYHSWLVRVRKFGDIWLPVEWREHMIT